MTLTTEELLEIVRDFLDGNLTPKEIRTSEKRVRGHKIRAAVAFTVFLHQQTTQFSRQTVSLNRAIDALFPIVFKEDGRLFQGEFDTHCYDSENNWRLDERLVRFSEIPVMDVLRKAGLYQTEGQSATTVTTLLPPPQLKKLLAEYGDQPEAITDFLRVCEEAKMFALSARDEEPLSEQAAAVLTLIGTFPTSVQQEIKNALATQV